MLIPSNFPILASLALFISILASATPLLSPRTHDHTLPSLKDLALQKVLDDASPIFGPYVKNHTATATWMKKIPDSTQIIHMNLPGVHDTQTWNYTLATQQALQHVTALGDLTPYAPEIYRCQSQPIILMLDAGIRVFDLRIAFDVTNSSLVFWHSRALQSQTATMSDVLFGFYKWLDDHPSETLLLSFNYEGSTTRYAQNNADVQRAMYDVLTSSAAKRYFLQTQNEFGTLGQARGKITLLRRFSLSQLSEEYSSSLPGIYFPGSQWTDNGPDISLLYNASKNLTAYIEDFYEPGEPYGQGATFNIARKFNKTIEHLGKAQMDTYKDSLFWSFASSENDNDVPVETPMIMALGNGTEDTPMGGVNQRLVGYFQALKGTGKRLGIVMFDFFETPGELVPAFLDV